MLFHVHPHIPVGEFDGEAIWPSWASEIPSAQKEEERSEDTRRNQEEEERSEDTRRNQDQEEEERSEDTRRNQDQEEEERWEDARWNRDQEEEERWEDARWNRDQEEEERSEDTRWNRDQEEEERSEDIRQNRGGERRSEDTQRKKERSEEEEEGFPKKDFQGSGHKGDRCRARCWHEFRLLALQIRGTRLPNLPESQVPAQGQAKQRIRARRRCRLDLLTGWPTLVWWLYLLAYSFLCQCWLKVIFHFCCFECVPIHLCGYEQGDPCCERFVCDICCQASALGTSSWSACGRLPISLAMRELGRLDAKKKAGQVLFTLFLAGFARPRTQEPPLYTPKSAREPNQKKGLNFLGRETQWVRCGTYVSSLCALVPRRVHMILSCVYMPPHATSTNVSGWIEETQHIYAHIHKSTHTGIHAQLYLHTWSYMHFAHTCSLYIHIFTHTDLNAHTHIHIDAYTGEWHIEAEEKA